MRAARRAESTRFAVRRVILGAALLLVGYAQGAEPGPAPGDRIPPFSLPDQFGKVQTIESVKGPKGTMLVFFRSADW